MSFPPEERDHPSFERPIANPAVMERLRELAASIRELGSVVLRGLRGGLQINSASSIEGPIDLSEFDTARGSSNLILEAASETDDATVIYAKSGAFKWQAGATSETAGNSPDYHIQKVTGTPGAHTFTDAVVVSYDSSQIEIIGSVKLPGGVTITTGSGTPESALAAVVGSTYHRTDGGTSTSFYVKESGTGATGWVAK